MCVGLCIYKKVGLIKGMKTFGCLDWEVVLKGHQNYRFIPISVSSFWRRFLMNKCLHCNLWFRTRLPKFPLRSLISFFLFSLVDEILFNNNTNAILNFGKTKNFNTIIAVDEQSRMKRDNIWIPKKTGYKKKCVSVCVYNEGKKSENVPSLMGGIKIKIVPRLYLFHLVTVALCNHLISRSFWDHSSSALLFEKFRTQALLNSIVFYILQQKSSHQQINKIISTWFL